MNINLKSEQEYIQAGIKPIEPMTAYEGDDDEIEMMCDSKDYLAEEKFDGTRAIMHFYGKHNRLFSRRISKKTNWYSENTDSLPHLRDLATSLKGTIIDGEMFIPGQEFKEVSSTLNCLWDEAVRRQEDIGYICLNAFDILYYKGINLKNAPLIQRKMYLERVIIEINSEYVKLVDSFDDTICIEDSKVYPLTALKDFEVLYPNLNLAVNEHNRQSFDTIRLSKRAYYEFIIASGGEGLILKNKMGKYEHKRSHNYTKWKKFITRDVILLDFDSPTKEYKGKFPNDRWEYWEMDGVLQSVDFVKDRSAVNLLNKGYIPVTKFYYNDWVGNIIFGVIVTDDDYAMLQKSKKFKTFEFRDYDGYKILVVGDCAGFDEDQRIEFTKDIEGFKYCVVEVKANGLFPDTGKLRHPRFMRMRNDKGYEDCTFSYHIIGAK